MNVTQIHGNKLQKNPKQNKKTKSNKNSLIFASIKVGYWQGSL